MTPEDIDNMQAGREVDAKIHKALWRRHNVETDILRFQYCDGEHGKGTACNWLDIPRYSTDIAAAWLVVEKLRQMQRTITLGSLGVLPEPLSWGCNIFRGLRQLETITQAVGDTAPLAICRAALKAVLVRQDNVHQ